MKELKSNQLNDISGGVVATQAMYLLNLGAFGYGFYAGAKGESPSSVSKSASVMTCAGVLVGTIEGMTTTAAFTPSIVASNAFAAGFFSYVVGTLGYSVGKTLTA